jgi:hypothetical protein
LGRFPSAGKFLQAQGIPISVQKRSASLPGFDHLELLQLMMMMMMILGI